PETPSLGAQPAFYTTVQMLMFRDRLRVTEPMNEMAKGLSDGDLQRVADIISKLPPPVPVSDTPDAARMERGRALGQQYRCNFCHQADDAGRESVPRLAGQREDYLLKALRGYKDNSRHGYDASMSDVVYPLKDADFADLAYFLARLKWPSRFVIPSSRASPAPRNDNQRFIPVDAGTSVVNARRRAASD